MVASPDLAVKQICILDIFVGKKIKNYKIFRLDFYSKFKDFILCNIIYTLYIIDI